MGTITDLARTMLRGGIGVKDANKLISEAKRDGISTEEKTELQSILNSPEFADKFTAKGKETLSKFLTGAPNPTTPITPAPTVTPTTPVTPTPAPAAPARSVRELVPDTLSSITDIKALPEAFKADYAAVQADLVGHPGLTEDDKANRTFEFFQSYASKFGSLAYSAGEDVRDEQAKVFGEVLKSVGFGAMVNADNDKDGATAAVEILRGDSPDAFTVRADHKPWTTTYWPMAGSMRDPDGSASSNLWAKDGALAKFDKFLEAKGKKTGALEFERNSNLAWMLGRDDIMKGATRRDDAQKVGHYIPDSTLSEKDAERTTGVDFNANGKLDENVEWDFLDGYGQFGTDGKTDGTMSTGWWGSCDKVALAGNLFKEPKKDVTIDGVTFTAQDIKGLLTVIADSQSPNVKWAGSRYDAEYDVIKLKSGQSITGRIETSFDLYQEGMKRREDRVEITTGFPEELTIKTAAGETKTVKAAEIASVNREDKKDDAGLFHTTIREWLSSGMPAVMDKDSGDHVWNYNFWKVEDKETTEKPSWVTEKMIGINGPMGDGKVTYVDREVQLGGGGSREHYQYWVEEKNGKIVNSGWAPSSGNPDFLWGPAKAATFTGANDRNPFVDPALVKEIYEKSIEP